MGKKNKKEMEHEEHVHEQCRCHEGGSCSCGEECCCEDGSFEVPHLVRQFYTRAEKIEMLEAYLAELKNEVQAVEEELAELKK